jgi:hypothetical protein
MLNINDIQAKINELKTQRSILEGQKQQLEQHLNNVILPKFEELGVTNSDIEATIKVEEEELTKGYNEVQTLINELNNTK